jgi:hypothetical protein
MMAAESTIYRVQDISGRGPFRPGFSQYWASRDVMRPKAWTEEFPGLLATIRASAASFHYGCGCRGLFQLARWFLPEERPRLAALGYAVVSMPAEILAVSDDQLVFMRRAPLYSGILMLSWGALP